MSLGGQGAMLKSTTKVGENWNLNQMQSWWKVTCTFVSCQFGRTLKVHILSCKTQGCRISSWRSSAWKAHFVALGKIEKGQKSLRWNGFVAKQLILIESNWVCRLQQVQWNKCLVRMEVSQHVVFPCISPSLRVSSLMDHLGIPSFSKGNNTPIFTYHPLVPLTAILFYDRSSQIQSSGPALHGDPASRLSCDFSWTIWTIWVFWSVTWWVYMVDEIWWDLMRFDEICINKLDISKYKLHVFLLEQLLWHKRGLFWFRRRRTCPDGLESIWGCVQVQRDTWARNKKLWGLW